MVLVTGAAGFLGKAVVEQLRLSRLTVVAVGRPGGGSDLECDLSDPGGVSRLLKETRPDVVVNLAAKADFSINRLAALFPVNTLCPAVIAAWCAQSGGYLVHASMAVHGRLNAHFGLENPGKPETDYGTSKWLADQAISASGCRSAVIRFGGVFGRGGPRHLGLNRALDGARAGQRPTMVGSGAAKRNYIHVNDAAVVVSRCIAERLTGMFYSGGEVQTIASMLQAICDVWLPGERPAVEAGAEGADQIVEASPELGTPRCFRDALQDCR